MREFRASMNYALRLTFSITIPASIGLWILAPVIVRILFQRGEFTPHAVDATAGALRAFAIGMPFVSGVRMLVPGFFALKDAKTPVTIATVAVVVNAVTAYLLMQPLKHVGLALAIAIAASVNFSLLLVFFRRRAGLIGGRVLVAGVVRIVLCSASMGGVVLLLIAWGDFFEGVGKWIAAAQLFAAIFASIAVYLGLLRIASPVECAALIGILKRRRVPTPAAPTALEEERP